MTMDIATASAPSRSLVPIEWVQTHNPQDVLLLAHLLRQAPPAVRKAINARLPRVETAEEIGALMAIVRCLSRIHLRAARRQLLEMVADASVPLEKVELAAALHYTQQEKEQLSQIQAALPEPPHTGVLALPLGDELAGLNRCQRLARKPYMRRAFGHLGHLAATFLQGVSFISGWLGGLVAGSVFCAGLVILAYGLLQPIYINDWLAFILDTRFTHYVGWLALAMSGWLLPVLLVLLPLRWALGLYLPLRHRIQVRRSMRILRQIQWDLSNPNALSQRAQEQARSQHWHSDFYASVAHWLFVGLAVLGGLVSVASAAVFVAKPCAGLLLAHEWFWPIVVGVTVLGYLICALYQFYEACLQRIEDQT